MAIWRWDLESGLVIIIILIKWFSGSDDDDYDEDSSEEGGDGPFNMVTETYNPEEDYEDYEL